MKEANGEWLRVDGHVEREVRRRFVEEEGEVGSLGGEEAIEFAAKGKARRHGNLL